MNISIDISFEFVIKNEFNLVALYTYKCLFLLHIQYIHKKKKKEKIFESFLGPRYNEPTFILFQ
jgi:hypothetical protein